MEHEIETVVKNNSDDSDDTALNIMRALAPMVAVSATCIVSFSDRICGKETGISEPGIDADLCLEHRELMESQRRENARIWSELNG
jgi:hypothetical protein